MTMGCWAESRIRIEIQTHKVTGYIYAAFVSSNNSLKVLKDDRNRISYINISFHIEEENRYKVGDKELGVKEEVEEETERRGWNEKGRKKMKSCENKRIKNDNEIFA